MPCFWDLNRAAEYREDVDTIENSSWVSSEEKEDWRRFGVSGRASPARWRKDLTRCKMQTRAGEKTLMVA